MFACSGRRGQALLQCCACTAVMYMHSVVGRAERQEEYRWCSAVEKAQRVARFYGFNRVARQPRNSNLFLTLHLVLPGRLTKPCMHPATSWVLTGQALCVCVCAHVPGDGSWQECSGQLAGEAAWWAVVDISCVGVEV